MRGHASCRTVIQHYLFKLLPHSGSAVEFAPKGMLDFYVLSFHPHFFTLLPHSGSAVEFAPKGMLDFCVLRYAAS